MPTAATKLTRTSITVVLYSRAWLSQPFDRTLRSPKYNDAPWDHSVIPEVRVGNKTHRADAAVSTGRRVVKDGVIAELEIVSGARDLVVELAAVHETANTVRAVVAESQLRMFECVKGRKILHLTDRAYSERRALVGTKRDVTAHPRHLRVR